MTTALVRPARILQEATPTDLYIRAIDRARELRTAARNRAEAEFAERVEEAHARFMAATASSESSDAAETSVESERAAGA